MALKEASQVVLSAISSKTPLMAEASRMVKAYEKEVGSKTWYIKVAGYPAGQSILEAEPVLQIAVVQSAFSSARSWGLDALLDQLLRRNLPYSAADLEAISVQACKTGETWGKWNLLLRVLQNYSAKNTLTPEMRASIQTMHDGCYGYSTASRKTKNLAADVLGILAEQLPDPGEKWTDIARADLSEMPNEKQDLWKAIFAHAQTSDAANPSAKWQMRARESSKAVGEKDIAYFLSSWLFHVVAPVFNQAVPKEPAANDLLIDPRAYDKYLQARGEYYRTHQLVIKSINGKNLSILKGLLWYAADCSSPDVARALAHVIGAAFQNIHEHGPWTPRVGSAAIWALGQMPNGAGVGPLARLRTRLRNRSALKRIAASIETAAAKAGMTVDELEDITVPTGGLDADGTRRETFGENGAAMLTLDAKNAKTNLQWFGPDGKPRKAVPTAVKASAAAEVKALKAAEEEIKQALGTQAARLDRALLDERTWTGAEWRERYLSHPILGNLTRRLLWTFDGQDGLPVGDEILTAENGRLDLGDSTVVRLWHPIGHTPQEVMRWRDALEARGIVQPFKQAHREVYLLTDAERNTQTYSNRFAAHILKQHQFNSLALLRGWKNQLRLMVDSSYPPAVKELPQHNLRAEFWIEGIGDDYGTDTNETGTYLRLATDQVRFYGTDAPTNHAHAGGGGYAPIRAARAEEALPLDQIPPLVFSEVMRDVDLFVGVASLGNDPNWADGGPQGRFRSYWYDYSFGDLTESAKTRADVLARLLPRLKIAGRSQLDGRFLTVRGDLRTYKIHLGSGNILMEPNDQYLCIVPKSGGDETGGLFLPFEGDRTLAVILSKAFLLADDTRITDPTITRQIQVK